MVFSIAIAVAFLSAFFLAQLPGDRTPHSTRNLIEAAAAGDITSIEQLVGKRIAIDSENKMGQSALNAAASAERTEIVKLLISQGANIHRNVLHSAAERGHTGLIELRICKGAHVNKHVVSMKNGLATDNDADEMTAVEIANQHGHAQIVALLRKHGGQ